MLQSTELGQSNRCALSFNSAHGRCGGAQSPNNTPFCSLDPYGSGNMWLIICSWVHVSLESILDNCLAPFYATKSEIVKCFA